MVFPSSRGGGWAQHCEERGVTRRSGWCNQFVCSDVTGGCLGCHHCLCAVPIPSVRSLDDDGLVTSGVRRALIGRVAGPAVAVTRDDSSDVDELCCDLL